MLHIVLMFRSDFLVLNIINLIDESPKLKSQEAPREVIPKLLSHSDFCLLHTYLFSVVKNVFRPLVYSILEEIFFVLRSCTY